MISHPLKGAKPVVFINPKTIPFMKKYLLLFPVVVALFALLPGCSKEGPAGPAGANGTNGNANVVMFKFNNQTTAGASLGLSMPLRQSFVDSSLVLCYANPEGQDSSYWMPIPGIAANAEYETRSFLVRYSPTDNNCVYNIRLYNVGTTIDFPTSITYRTIRVVFVPASSILSGKNGGPVDFSNYYSVKRYFNLRD